MSICHPYCWSPYHVFVHSHKIQNGEDICPNLGKLDLEKNESWIHHNLERTHDWCSAVGKVAI